jgi:GTP-binding protein LepA
MHNADIESAKEQIVELLGCDKDRIIPISARDGIGIQGIFDAIINFIPPPKIKEEVKTRGLIFDSTFDQYRGVIPYIRMVDGYLAFIPFSKYPSTILI